MKSQMVGDAPRCSTESGVPHRLLSRCERESCLSWWWPRLDPCLGCCRCFTDGGSWNPRRPLEGANCCSGGGWQSEPGPCRAPVARARCLYFHHRRQVEQSEAVSGLWSPCRRCSAETRLTSV